jgi:hypothetical protein
MPRSLEPLVDYAARIATTRTRVTELLEIYQSKMARVRKEETEQTVIEEGEALANFVASLKELNLSSNNYLVAFQTTYTPSWKHFSHGLAQIALRFGEIADTPATAVLTDEERALDNELLELQREIEQSEAQATPP